MKGGLDHTGRPGEAEGAPGTAPKRSAGGVLAPLLIACGVLSDGLAGLAVLGGLALYGIGLHLAANLIWIAGIVLLRASDVRPPGRPSTAPSGPREARRLPQDGIARNRVAFLIGLALFPGLGPLAYTFALVTNRLVGRPPTPQARPIDEGLPESWPGPEARPGRSVGAARPLIELLRAPDTESKKDALQRIVQEPGARAISLARCLLGDPDPDVRALAALAVSRLESSLSQALRESVLRCRTDPENPEFHADLGALFHQWAEKDEAHPAQRRLYLRQARQEFEKSISLGPRRVENLLGLAEVLIALKEHKRASEALETALADGGASLEANMLGMEIAFRERRFDRLGDLAQRSLPLAGKRREAGLLEWWLPLQSPPPGRPS